MIEDHYTPPLLAAAVAARWWEQVESANWTGGAMVEPCAGRGALCAAMDREANRVRAPGWQYRPPISVRVAMDVRTVPAISGWWTVSRWDSRRPVSDVPLPSHRIGVGFVALTNLPFPGLGEQDPPGPSILRSLLAGRPALLASILPISAQCQERWAGHPEWAGMVAIEGRPWPTMIREVGLAVWSVHPISLDTTRIKQPPGGWSGIMGGGK